MFGYALKSILRTPVKTILFIVLVVAVTVFSCLGFGMWNASAELLRRADQTYTTAALIEYVDDGYPSSTDYTPTMVRTLKEFDYSVLSDQEEVLGFDRQYDIGGHMEDFSMGMKREVYGYSNIEYQDVVLLRYMFTTSRGDVFIVRDIMNLGTRGSAMSIKTGMQINLSFDEGQKDPGEGNFIPGHFYIAHGFFNYNLDHSIGFIVTAAENDAAPQDAEETLRYPFLDVGESAEEETWPEEAEYLASQARFYALQKTHITVHPTTNVSLATPFLQQETHLLEGGRYFTEEEYTEGAKKIIVSQRLATSMEKSIGDTIQLNLYSAFTAFEDGLTGTSDFWPSRQTFLDSGEYEIVGVFQNTDTLLKTVYIPLPPDTPWLKDTMAGYQMAVVRLKNGSGDSYYAKVKPHLSANMRLMIYDQGYSEAVAPVLSMQRTAVLISLVSLLSALAVLLLFAYMYVSRQKSTAETMTALGTGRKKTTAYLMFCVLLVAFISVVIGLIIGYFLSERVTRSAYEQALSTTNVDHRFSAVYTNVEIIKLETDFTPELLPLLLVGGSVFLVSLLYAFLLTFGVFRRKNGEKTRKAGAEKAKKTGKAQKAVREGREPQSRATTTSPALASILRGGAKNLIVPLVSLVLITFIGIFSGQIIRSEDEIGNLYDNSTVLGYYTTMNGWRVDGLGIERDSVEQVLESPFIDTVYKSCMRMTEDGPKVVFTNNLRYSPEFFFGDAPIVTWLSGYDESIFQGTEEVCLISTQYAKKTGLQSGDTLNIKFSVVVYPEEYDVEMSAKIVGMFNCVSADEHFYFPFSMSDFMITVPVHTRVGYVYEEIPYSMTYSSLSFKLRDLRNLAEFKEDLDERGYTSIGKFDRARKFVVIEDTLLNASVSSLERHIAYMRILFIVTYLLAAVIGFVISYLMTKSRRKELAMMRSMGAGRVRTFFAFFTEQAVLAVIGFGLGIAVLGVCLGGIFTVQWPYFLGYLACYILGIALSILVMNRVNVMGILTKED